MNWTVEQLKGEIAGAIVRLREGRVEQVIEALQMIVEDELIGQAYAEMMEDEDCKHVIRGKSDPNDDYRPMFWSNEMGWVSLPDADVYDKKMGDLPVGAIEWMTKYEADLMDCDWRESLPE